MSRQLRIRVCPDGPVLVRGAEAVVDERGEQHTVTRPVVALCVCGRSSLTPWCDGTHQMVTGRSTDDADDG
ncbi:MAG TPA: CDGSH iron-sulfur domain-containing protein [Nocardioides sp.]|uniref:CDGSH iron-sulfur domain-containing protein n=1 Tax=Nocardioides sp. TaxID=35761 RepID=UPI002F401BBF